MVAIVDYGVGNLFSLASSFRHIGEEVLVTSDEKEICTADRILLPGVGAFEDARKKLSETGLIDVLRDEVAQQKPLLGVCLGMQLLFDESEEFGLHKGLGFVPGRVVGMQGKIPKSLLIPHIGWNTLKKYGSNPLLSDVNDGDYVYFVHSFYAVDCGESLIATTDYGVEMTAAVAHGNVYGCQFHPEKSGEVGLNILRAFCRI